MGQHQGCAEHFCCQNEHFVALTDWLLFRNRIIPADQVIDAETLPQFKMPNRDGFVPDPRPDVE
jgi:S-disulfanyl-L-cysteine oxidoreductase SoxD